MRVYIIIFAPTTAAHISQVEKLSFPGFYSRHAHSHTHTQLFIGYNKHHHRHQHYAFTYVINRLRLKADSLHYFSRDMVHIIISRSLHKLARWWRWYYHDSVGMKNCNTNSSIINKFNSHLASLTHSSFR
jgi:hypothetical protein